MRLLLLVLLAACASTPHVARVDLDLHDADIYDALRLVATSARVNIDADAGLTGRVTMRVHGVPWDEALRTIARDHGLRVVVTGPVVHVSDAAKPAAPAQAFTGAPITARFDDTPIRDAVRTIAETAGTRIAVDDDVQVAVTLHLRGVAWDLALDHLVRKYELKAIRGPDGIRIAKP